MQSYMYKGARACKHAHANVNGIAVRTLCYLYKYATNKTELFNRNNINKMVA